MNKVYLLLGSNTGDSKQMLAHAEKNIATAIGNIKKRSSVYQTAAWGNTDQPDFLNKILVVDTKLSAPEILQRILSIEAKMGRTRTFKNAPRTIDIDILFFNTDVINTNDLTVPHPEIQNRRFVLEPLAAISPAMLHPILHKTVAQLLTECSDMLNVQKI